MRSTQQGFNLVEVIVAMAILAILLSLGTSSYRSYIVNQRLRSTAEVFMVGIQTARAEAINRNQSVQFILTDVAPTAGQTLANLASLADTDLSATGRTWIIRAVNRTTPVSYTFVEGKSGAETGGGASSSSSPISIASHTGSEADTDTPSVSSITFDGLGTPTNITDPPVRFSFSYSNPGNDPNLNCASAGGPIRCLQVRVQRGGQIRLCDPAVDTVGDTRRCT